MNDKLTRHNLWLVLALVIPIVAIVGLIARSEILLRGQEWRFRVRGHDPRDMLRGNYIALNVDWGILETASAVPWDERCLCLQRNGEERRVTELACVDATSCNVRITSEEQRALARFYIPEDPQRARELEQGLSKATGELILVERLGKLSVKDLLIDGLSWKLYSAPAEQ